MRWITRAMALVAVFTVSAVAAWAQTPECTDDFKTAKYTEWYENRKDKQDVAYKAANDFLTACPNEPADGPWAQQLKALQKFKGDYEAALQKGKVATDFKDAISKKELNYKDILRTGKAYVAIDPNNSTAYLYMAAGGLIDASLLAEASQYAPKAIELVEAGKPVDPYKTKDQALAAMNYLIAKSKATTAPADAIPYFIKAAKYNSDLKKDPKIYNELAAAYAEQVDKLTNEYKQYIGKPETTESKLVVANLNQAIDAQIDALARATALADAANKPALMARLTDVYKDRKKSDAGLNELVTGILSKPLPDPPKPITELPTPPTPTATPTPAATSAPGAAGTSNGASSTAAKPSTNASSTSAGRNNATSTPGSTTGTAKPAASPSPTPKPRSRRTNHRG